MVHNMQLITHNSLSPIFSARCNINARAASYSLGMMPSKMASLMALFKAPTCWQGERPKVFMISSPLTGGWKLRIRSRSSKSFSFWRTY